MIHPAFIFPDLFWVESEVPHTIQKHCSSIHHIDLALQYCDRVIGVRAGEIVFDGPASTITQEQIDFVYNGTKAPTLGDGE